ncbi:MAG: alpha/beta hydrolase [Blautia sp.]|jgi:acetyl esterase
MERTVQLERAAAAVSDAAMACPRIYQLPPRQGRLVLEKMQDEPVPMYPAKIESGKVMTQRWGRLMVYRVIPECLRDPVDVIFYLHGGGWVFGSFHTHEKLVRELAARTGCMVVFPEYVRAPEARYPVAIEQCYDLLCMLPQLLAQWGHQMNSRTLTVAGDSAGGNMAIAMTLMAKYRKGPNIHKQLLYYPVTNACFDTESYDTFAEGYYLHREGMKWFWEQYAPSPKERKQITASPLCAKENQLRGLPQALIINGEADVLRDEGEAYARKLRAAGVPTAAARFQAAIHDFVMLHALDQTEACRAAMDLSTTWIFRKNTEENSC